MLDLQIENSLFYFFPIAINNNRKFQTFQDLFKLYVLHIINNIYVKLIFYLDNYNAHAITQKYNQKDFTPFRVE